MGKQRSARLSQRILKQDRQIAKAVLSFDDYAPSNKDFTAKRIKDAVDAVMQAEKDEAAAMKAASVARDKAVAAEALLHELVLGAKRQVIAQYGEDSDQITALGLKKKSERRYGRPRKKRDE
jgi:hypothetical protein